MIIKIQGGLGNQLQQYALYEKLKSLGKEVRVDTSWYAGEQKKNRGRKLELLFLEGLEWQECTEKEKETLLGKYRTAAGRIQSRLFFPRKYYGEKDVMYEEDLFRFRDMYLDGYWSCEKYYHDMIPLLQEKIRFPENDNQNHQALKKQISAQTSVSIHIRRGDYLNPENEALFGGICTDAYYDSAAGLIRRKYPEARFYVFSDDYAYAAAKYAGQDATVVNCNQGENSFYDCELMSLCSHNICANSTFSFWGARLNRNPRKTVIRPLKHRNTLSYEPQQMLRLWEGYTLVDEKGQVWEGGRQ